MRAGARPTNDSGVELVKTFEGYSARPYMCPARVWTIGYGATKGLDNRPVTPEHPHITRDQGTTLLRRDLGDSERAVARLSPVAINDNQYATLVSFVFNCGAGAYQRSTLRQVVNRGDHADVPAELMKWVRGGGQVLPGLVRRRRAEGALYQRQ